MDTYEQWDRLYELMGKHLILLHNSTLINMGHTMLDEFQSRFPLDEEMIEMAELLNSIGDKE